MLLNHRWSSLLVPEKWWQTPHVGFFKINVDGVLNMSLGTRGVGMVVRDSKDGLCRVVAMRAPSLLPFWPLSCILLKLASPLRSMHLFYLY
ncbi:unnamed protein product [Prunus armeniaca]|uniref:Uncharacterized protein n=1 Tax=Prunus armeniaca TaxID=36596 RepID=A0A6J5UCR6_PRUAR|nr:unnamed protein product [Prunus armeniaca]